MTPKPPFLWASDYCFYIKKHSEIEIEPSVNKHNKMSTLLKKLSEDICEGPIGFVEDFIEEPNEGISALLDYLKISLNRQQSPISMPYMNNNRMSNETGQYHSNPNYNQAQRNRDRQQLMKRAMADEYDCLLCLKYSILRKDITLSKILLHKSGLTSIGSCIVSNLVKSRTIALEILTKICNIQPEGYSKVLEAMTIMRILFGESVRFKLLVALVNSNNINYDSKSNYRSESSERSSSTGTNSECDPQSNSVQFELVVLRFINCMLANAQLAQRVRLQCELEEAGFSIHFIEQKLNSSIPESQGNKIKFEIMNYKTLYIDIGKLMLDCQQALQRESELKEDVDSLHFTLSKLEKEKIDLLHEKQELKERCAEQDDEIKKLRGRYLKNSHSSLESKKLLINHHNDSNRSVSDISHNGNNNSVNSDSGRWSTSDSEEAVSLTVKNDTKSNESEMMIKTKRLQQDTKKPTSYFKLNSMNSLKSKELNKIRSKSDQNLEHFEDNDEDCEKVSRNGENVRNEDIFIYVPTIREKNNSKLMHNNSNPGNQMKVNSRIFETNNRSNKQLNSVLMSRFNTTNCSLQDWSNKMNKTNQELSKKLSEQEELNKSQSNMSSNSSTSSQKSNKPQIVNVYPKRSNSIGELLNTDQLKPCLSDDLKDNEEIKKSFCSRKQMTKSSITLKQSKNDSTNCQTLLNKNYKSNLKNSIDTLSTNNSDNNSALSEDDNNAEDYEELIASTLQQKRIVKPNEDLKTGDNSIRRGKLYASFANGHSTNDRFNYKSDYSTASLFRTGNCYTRQSQNNPHKSTGNLSNSNLNNCNLSNSSSQNALVNGEFYLMKGATRQSSINSLNMVNEMDKYESLPPNIYGKHLSLSKDKYSKPDELEIVQQQNASTLQHSNKKERNTTDNMQPAANVNLSIQELQTKKSKSFKTKTKINKNNIALVENSCINLGLNSLGLNSSSLSSHQGLSSSVSDVHREIAIAAKELGASAVCF